MQPTSNIHSIKKPIFLWVIGLVGVAWTVIILLITQLYLGDITTKIKNDTQQLTQFIALNSANYVKDSQQNNLTLQLDALKEIPDVNYAHIYIISPNDGEVTFFASYNRNTDFPAIPNKVNQYSNLSIPRYQGSIIEYMVPIENKSNRYGYVYLQTSADELKNAEQQVILIIIVVIFVLLLTALFISHRMQMLFTSPINTLMEDIRTIAQKKDYQLRCRQLPYQEVDIIAKNINIMLRRTEKHIAKQETAEQQILTLNQELEDKVNLRTQALKESNQELVSTLEKLHRFQHQLVENEKMASLGDMVAGIAHEINTPIGLGITASSLLDDRLAEIIQDFEQKALKSSQLKKFLYEGQENLHIIQRNLDRSAKLIRNFKKVAVDGSSETDSEVNIKQLIGDTLLALPTEYKYADYEFIINCDDQLNLLTKPKPITQILTNLVINSIIHGFGASEQGKITINVEYNAERLSIIYQDDGSGIDEHIKAKIFEPFTTTKRGEGGSGLGLHLVYNLVTQALGGTIILTNQSQQGVCFEISFPIVEL